MSPDDDAREPKDATASDPPSSEHAETEHEPARTLGLGPLHRHRLQEER